MTVPPLPPLDISATEHNERMAAAKARAQWELGDPSWAAVIVRAYLHPDEDRESLKLEMTE